MQLPIASNYNILIADKRGKMVVVECTPNIKKIGEAKSVDDGYLVCTVNSFISDKLKPYDFAKGDDYHSYTRYSVVMGLNPYKSLPALFYGIILFMCAVSYNIVQAEVIKINGKDSQIFRNIGNDLKGKLSIIAYAAAIIFAFYFPVISYLIYIAIALTWIVPDSRLEKA